MAFRMRFNSLDFFAVIAFLINGVKPDTNNVALNKTVTSKSVYQSPIWADLAVIVDGDLRRDGMTCECCAATAQQDDPWMTVDLGDEFWIENVIVYGRTDNQIHLAPCKSGKYGINCDQICGQCYNGESCDEVTGGCTRCAPGYTEALCKTACSAGAYGDNCTQECGHCSNREPCDFETGVCHSCSQGFQGLDCKQECTPGSYGQDCSSFCGFCWKYEPCNHATGLCPSGCAAGRQGDICKQACDNNTFGANCSLRCHCVDDNSCDSITGECDDSECTEGFFGDDCQQIKESPKVDDTNNDTVTLAMLIGVVCVLDCIIIVLLVTGVCFLKKRKLDNRPLKGETNQTDEHNYEDLQMQ